MSYEVHLERQIQVTAAVSFLNGFKIENLVCLSAV